MIACSSDPAIIIDTLASNRQKLRMLLNIWYEHLKYKGPWFFHPSIYPANQICKWLNLQYLNESVWHPSVTMVTGKMELMLPHILCKCLWLTAKYTRNHQSQEIISQVFQNDVENFMVFILHQFRGYILHKLWYNPLHVILYIKHRYFSWFLFNTSY